MQLGGVARGVGGDSSGVVTENNKVVDILPVGDRERRESDGSLVIRHLVVLRQSRVDSNALVHLLSHEKRPTPPHGQNGQLRHNESVGVTAHVRQKVLGHILSSNGRQSHKGSGALRDAHMIKTVLDVPPTKIQVLPVSGFHIAP